MRNGFYEVWEVELAAAGRGDRDGKGAIRADVFREREEVASRLRRAAFARRVSLEETRSLCRRAERAHTERLLRESRALREAAERRAEAPWTPMGVLLRAGLLTR